MIKDLLLLASFLFVSGPAFSKTFFVSTSGDDSYPGTLEQPFQTFAKASSQMFAGDTLYIRGGTYNQILQLARSGSYVDPIVITAYPGERVVITALEPLSGWVLDEGQVYKTSVSWNLGQKNMVMCGDTVCDLARWPNNTDGKIFTLNSLRNTGGSTAGVITDAWLDYSPGIPDLDWSKGGSVFFYCDKAGWIAWKAFIKSNTTTRLTFDLNKNPDWIRTQHPPSDLGDFYLEGIREAIDYPGEWFFDESSGTLYLQPPGGTKPADSTVLMRKRTQTIKLTTDFIVVKNLEVLGGSIEITGDYNQVYGVKSIWGDYNRGVMTGFSTNTQSVLIQGTYNRLEKCEIGYGSATGVKVQGSYNQILNCYIHDFNTLGSYDAPIRARDGGTSITLSRNTVARGGRDCIQANIRNTVLSYNDVSASNLIADDCGLYYIVGGPYNITIHHNWFHDTWSRGSNYKAAGIYLDNDAAGFDVHHNVVWDTEWSSIQMNKDVRDINVFNNTFWNGSSAMGAWHATGTHFERVLVYNNLADNTDWEEQADKQNNLTLYTNPFVNSDVKNWQLKPGTQPIDYGRTISGYTEGYIGSRPDAGAYEYGQPMWRAGIDWEPSLGPDACLEGDVYEETEGIVIVEAESASVVGKGWKVLGDVPSSGTGYLEYAGPDETSGFVDSTVCTYRVKISNPGSYRFLWRSRNGISAPDPDHQNSSWLSIECDEFYGMANGTKQEIGDTFAAITVHDTSGWTWVSHAGFDGTDSLELYARFDYSGIYELRVAGMASGHLIDRLVLFQANREAFATDSSARESWTGCDEYTVPNQWATPKTAAVEYHPGEFIIDGRMDGEWKKLPEFTGAHSLMNEGDLPPGTDLSYSFRVSVSDSALFLWAYVIDDTLSAYTGMEGDYEAWDNLELFLNADNNHMPLGVYGDNALHIRLNYGMDDFLSIGNGRWKAGDYEGFRCITADTAGGYTLEARIPWKGIYPLHIAPGTGRSMGFEIQVNDRDMDPLIQNKLAWANNTGIDFTLYDTRKFGTLSVNREETPVYVTGVRINADTLVMKPGQILILTADVIPDNAQNKTVTWNTLDATVVSVAYSTGIVKGLYYGTTRIIATTQDGGFTDTCVVIVSDPGTYAEPGNRMNADPAEFELVPNPATSYFWVKGINHWTKIKVYDITGGLVSDSRYGDKGEYVEVGQLPAGLYLVRIYSGEKVYTRKLIISDSIK